MSKTTKILRKIENTISVLVIFLAYFSFIHSFLCSSVAFAAGEFSGEVKLPSLLGVQKIEVGKKIKVDGKDFPFTFLDGMLISDGKRTVTINEKKYTIEVKTLPDKENIELISTPYAYEFSKQAKIFEPTTRLYKTLSSGFDIFLTESPKIAIFEDKANNVSDVIFIPSLLEKLDILDSQTPITNITGKKFLLSSKSPYRIFGKVILPEKSALILEEGVTIISALNSELSIKGMFATTGPITILQSGMLNVIGNGILYLNGLAQEINVSSDKGALVFLDNSQINDANLSFTNFIVIRNSVVRNLTINGGYAVFLLNSQVLNLTIQNCGRTVLNGVLLGKVSVSTLSRVIMYNSKLTELAVTDLSEINIINSSIDTILAQRGAIVKLKNAVANSLSAEDYSISYLFKSTIGTLSYLNSKYYLLETKPGKIVRK